MKNPVVVVGIGEMGSVFARGFLRLGHPVYPVVRDAGMAETAGRLTDPELVVIAVAEKDLQAALQVVPDAWRDRLVLHQNELLPADWLMHDLDPTVISVWFEKRKAWCMHLTLTLSMLARAAAPRQAEACPQAGG